MNKKTKLKPYISNLTAKKYSSIFTGLRKKGVISLCTVNQEYLDELIIRDEGTVSYKKDWLDTLKPLDFEKILVNLDDEYDVDLPLMQSVYSVFYQSLMDGNSLLDGSMLIISTKMLAKYVNSAGRNNGYEVFYSKLFKFNNVYAFIDDQYLIKFLSFSFHDRKAGILKFDVSLLKWLIERVQEENIITIKEPYKKEFTYEIPTHSFLIHSSISRRNKNAYFLVTQIEALLVQAGVKAPEVHITFENLIAKVPTLERMLENKSSADKNKALKRVFSKLYELLKTSTDLYEYYTDLDIPNIIPTQSALDQVLRITHKGVNKDYKPKEK